MLFKFQSLASLNLRKAVEEEGEFAENPFIFVCLFILWVLFLFTQGFFARGSSILNLKPSRL
jgi:hypothetical protein